MLLHPFCKFRYSVQLLKRFFFKYSGRKIMVIVGKTSRSADSCCTHCANSPLISAWDICWEGCDGVGIIKSAYIQK
jgi:hypothetical protein